VKHAHEEDLCAPPCPTSERALGKHKREMLVIIKDVCDLVAVSARGKRPAAENPDDKQAAKRGSGAAATAPKGIEALPSVGIGASRRSCRRLPVSCGCCFSSSRELLEAIKGLGGRRRSRRKRTRRRSRRSQMPT